MPTTYIQETTIDVGHGQENRLPPSEIPLLSTVSKSVLHDVWSGSKLAAIKTEPPRTCLERFFLDVSGSRGQRIAVWKHWRLARL